MDYVMKDDGLRQLATAAGLVIDWIDALGGRRTVGEETLRVVLDALDLPAGNAQQIAASRRHLAAEQSDTLPPMLLATAGQTVELSTEPHSALIHFEEGGEADCVLQPAPRGVAFTAPTRIGYHRLELDGRMVTLAIAPRRAWTLAEAAPGRRPWGIATQLYALRCDGTPYGDFAALAPFVGGAAEAGADAVAISPVHALFASDPSRYSPYAPSSRLYLNEQYAPTTGSNSDGGTLIHWPEATVRKIAALRRDFDALAGDGEAARTFERFIAEGGDALAAHARFEVLDRRFRSQGLSGWRSWPSRYHRSDDAAVRQEIEHDPELRFHLFAQWRAREGLARAQHHAKERGMAIGLIADMAVGVEAEGSQTWWRPEDFLGGLSIGAPPDLINGDGQNWGLAGFSPRALQRSQYRSYLETLRAVLRDVGGARIDHAVGLRRMWVIPQGAAATEGVYLTFPLDDLLRLLALESRRHRAILVAEDLGTVPEGLRSRLSETGILGTRVLWFERGADGTFLDPASWDADVAAMTTTHDLPTVAGWWRGRDIAWLRKIHGIHDVRPRRAERDADRTRLWKAMRKTGCVAGDAPPLTEPDTAVAGALEFVGATPSSLALLPMEDLLGQIEQPNLPGTIEEHPNWRRRYPAGDLFARPDVKRRLAGLRRRRAQP